MEREIPAGIGMEVTTAMKPEQIDARPQSLPPSCLGPDGKLPRLTEEEHRRYIESACGDWMKSSKSPTAKMIHRHA